MAFSAPQIDQGLDEIAELLASITQRTDTAIERMEGFEATLVQLPTQFGDLLQAIDDLPGSDEWETAVQARKARYVTAFQAERDRLQAINQAIDQIEARQ